MMNNKRLVWPLSIRIIHWVLAVIIILNMFLLESGDPPHRYLGYAGVAIVLIRFCYGFMGRGHVAFKTFPMHPKKLFHFITTHFGKNKTDYEGHNPLASYVYFLMWFAVIALGVTGYLLGTDRFWGDEGMEDLHIRISYFLEALIVFHFTGIIVDSILFKRKSWMGMIK